MLLADIEYGTPFVSKEGKNMRSTIDLSQRHKKMSGMFIKSVTSRLGCLGLPGLANFPLKCMEIYVAFDRLPLPRIGEFPYCLHTSRKC